MDIEAIQSSACPTDEFSAYIDGELPPSDELMLEMHLAECPPCTLELNRQKQFLCGLSSTLKSENEIEMPADFAKLIVANAESSVSGLRRPREVYNAAFILVGLSLFVLFALGAEAGKTVVGMSAVLEKVSAVADVIGHLAYSIILGLLVIVRSTASQFRPESVLLVLGLCAGLVLLALVSRKSLPFRGI